MTISNENLLASSLKDRLELSFVEASGDRAFSQTGRINLANFTAALRYVLRFWGALMATQPDIVDIGSAHGGSFAKYSLMVFLARLAGRKVVLTPHCSLKIFLPASPQWWRRYVLFALRRCHGLAVLSKEWLPIKSFLPDCQVVYIPNGLHLDPFLAFPRPGLNEGTGKTKILYLGHIGRSKGLFDLLEAVKMLQAANGLPFEVNVIGEGLALGELEQFKESIRTKQLDPLVRVWPPEFGEQKLARLREADIYVLPSYHEGMPISLIEAMASGLPIVATGVGGIPDMVRNGVNGLLVSAGQPNELASALTRLITDREMRLEMGHCGRQIAGEHFNIETKVDRLMELYQSLVQPTA